MRTVRVIGVALGALSLGAVAGLVLMAVGWALWVFRPGAL